MSLVWFARFAFACRFVIQHTLVALGLKHIVLPDMHQFNSYPPTPMALDTVNANQRASPQLHALRHVDWGYPWDLLSTTGSIPRTFGQLGISYVFQPGPR
jgi:hypothetical protein